MRQAFAKYLIDNNRMVIEPTADIMQLFPLGVAASDKVAWLKAAHELLGGATELRKPFTPAGQWKLVVKDRSGLVAIAEADALAAMAQRRKAENQDA